MNSILSGVAEIEKSLDLLVTGAFSREEVPPLADDSIAELLASTGRMQRRLEALQIEATVQVRERSEGVRATRMTDRFGCPKPADLVRLLTGQDARSTHRLVKAAGHLRREQSMTEGAFLPCRYPALREAVVQGAIGLTGLMAAIDPLEFSAKRITHDARLRADTQLAALAMGLAPRDADAPTGDPAPLPTPEELSALSKVLVAYLDPDGAEPLDDLAVRGRSFTLGVARDGLVPVRGALLPEVAGQLRLLIDSVLNPRIDGLSSDADSGPGTANIAEHTRHHVEFVESTDALGPNESDAGLHDERIRTQKVHDALATIVTVAARTGQFPTLGGASPTLVVSISAKDFAAGSGWATVANTSDQVSARVAAQTGCAGGIQRVLFDDHGRISSLGTSARIFTALQRGAIAERDGGCIIPGRQVPATWCEIHHVTEHSQGGVTHTDNSTLLRWWHHRKHGTRHKHEHEPELEPEDEPLLSSTRPRAPALAHTPRRAARNSGRPFVQRSRDYAVMAWLLGIRPAISSSTSSPMRALSNGASISARSSISTMRR